MNEADLQNTIFIEKMYSELEDIGYENGYISANCVLVLTVEDRRQGMECREDINYKLSGELELVSVIIPIYNIEGYVDRCIQSAVNQTYKNIEIILVDDGSTDASAEKCNVWAKNDNRIKVLHKQNGGLSDARNAGLDIATGKYIYFLDGDDFIEPQLLTVAISKMSNDVDMVAFQHNTVQITGEKEVKISHSLGMFVLLSEVDKFNFMAEYLLSYKIGWEAWNRVYLREKIEKYHLRFADNRTIFAEDLYFCLAYCVHADKVLSISDRLYNYILRPDSIMGVESHNLNVGRINELSKAIRDYFQQFDDCDILIHNFPIIHWLIIENEIKNSMERLNEDNQVSYKEFRAEIYNDINDKKFFRRQIKEFIRMPIQFQTISLSGWAVRKSYAKYLLNGWFFGLRLRNHMIYRYSDFINRHSLEMRIRTNEYKRFSKKEKRIYLLGTETFGNLGDHGINEAIIAFLQSVVPDYSIMEITADRYLHERPLLVKYLKKSDLIVMPGGGNIGDEYPFSQRIKNDIIKTWRNNTKIIFPQTIFFSETERGKSALDECCNLLTAWNNIYLFAREKKSYTLSKNYFSCPVISVPDIVLFTKYEKQSNKEKSKIIFCMRNDVERRLSDYEHECLYNYISLLNQDILEADTQLNYHVCKEQRKTVIEQYLKLWSESRLVVTDRLHGMVFAAITGTPCVVFSNYNHKVQGTYDWISYLPYIKYVETVEEAKNCIPPLLDMRDCHYDNEPLMPYFEKLAEVVREKCPESV